MIRYNPYTRYFTDSTEITNRPNIFQFVRVILFKKVDPTFARNFSSRSAQKSAQKDTFFTYLLFIWRLNRLHLRQDILRPNLLSHFVYKNCLNLETSKPSGPPNLLGLKCAFKNS